MSKWSSPCCSVSFCLIAVLLSVAQGQQKDGEFKHELPDDVELVDPKSLGLTDADLTKFLGNVKVLGGGQVGDTKTQILSVGFDGDENINFNDFIIPGLTDGKNTSLPEKDKEIADMAFQKFKEFFDDPKKAKHFEENRNALPFNPRSKAPEKSKQHNNIPIPPQTPNQFHIPMIQKPYTTPRTPLTLPVTTHHPSHLTQQRPPPPPQQPQHNPGQQRPPQIRFPPNNQHSPPHQQAFNSQIKSPQQHLEFGARIPVSPNPQLRPQHHPPPQIHQQQFHQQNQPQFQQQQQQHHRIVIQHPTHQQQQQQNIHKPIHQQQPAPHIYVQPPAVQHFPQVQQQQQQQQQQQSLPPPHQQPVHQPPPQGRPQPLQNIIIQHPIPQNIQPQNQAQHRPPPQTPPLSQEQQGRVVRNQLLLESNNIQNTDYLNYHTPPQLRPPPPPPAAQTPPFPSATNQVPVHAHLPSHSHQPPSAAATATSHVYIQRGPKSTSNSIEHTPFHPQFQPPSRFAKDFTPMPIQLTTSRPIKYDITPSMKLIPLSTNENAITDPTRMLQLRLYQQQKAQAQAQAASSHQAQTVLPQQPSPTTPPTSTPIISITTSYPETHQFSSTDYQVGSQSQQFDPRLNNHIGTGSLQHNDVYNSKPIFPLQSYQQQSQQHQHSGPDGQYSSQQTQAPSVYLSPEHRRPPREGQAGQAPPRFQFHVSHELGQPPRFHMYPDPKNMLNSIRRKRGYRRLSELFNRMFRWDRH